MGGSEQLVISVEPWPLLGPGLASQARPGWPGSDSAPEGTDLQPSENTVERQELMRVNCADSCVSGQ